MARVVHRSQLLTLCLVLFHSSQFNIKGENRQQRAVDAWTNLIFKLTRTDASDYAYFNNTLDNILIPRVSGTLGNKQVREFIIGQMKKLGWDVQQDTFESVTPKGTKEFSNIIATLNPSSCRRLVLACHYDSKDIPGFLGATDSAVPCSMVIYLVWSLSSYLQTIFNQTDKYATLQTIFFDGEEAFKKWKEEDSLYGSRHLSDRWIEISDEPPFARSCPDKETELEKIELFVLLDLIGTKNVKFCSMFWNTHQTFMQFSDIENHLNALNVLEKEVPSTNTQYFGKECFLIHISDDHLPFLQKGVPVLHLIPPHFPFVWHQLIDDRTHLHQPTINNLNKILKVFIFKYLLRSNSSA